MDKPFKSDGCSGNLGWLFVVIYDQDEPPWKDCCEKHDYEYWQGGTKEQRVEADRALMECIVRNGYPKMAFLVWLFIRIMGYPYMPYWRAWGWGWNTWRGYQPRE